MAAVDDESTSPQPRTLRFGSGGASCAAWHFGPGTTSACVVMAHGLGAIKEVGLERFARRFLAAGHDVLAFDYRGFGESDGEPRQVVDIGAQQQDWCDAVEFARTLPGVGAGRIVLWGTSYSGGHVLALAAELDLIAAAFAQVPMADGLAAARGVGAGQMLRLAGHGLLDELGGRLGRAPHTVPITGRPGEPALLTSPDAHSGLAILNPEGHPWPNEIAARFVLRAGNYRPGRGASRIGCPLLVVICTDDVITPVAAAVRAAADAPRGELVRLPGGHYAVYEGEGLERAAGAELEFLERALGDRAPAPASGSSR